MGPKALTEDALLTKNRCMEHRTLTSSVETLNATDCWAYLNTNSFGRLAVLGRDGVDIFPVNYLTYQSSVLFRSAPGSKLIDVTDNPDVAFEIDGTDAGKRWSVVVRGVAQRLSSDAAIVASRIHQLPTETPTTKWNYVRITPRILTGRRLG